MVELLEVLGSEATIGDVVASLSEVTAKEIAIIERLLLVEPTTNYSETIESIDLNITTTSDNKMGLHNVTKQIVALPEPQLAVFGLIRETIRYRDGEAESVAISSHRNPEDTADYFIGHIKLGPEKGTVICALGKLGTWDFTRIGLEQPAEDHYSGSQKVKHITSERRSRLDAVYNQLMDRVLSISYLMDGRKASDVIVQLGDTLRETVVPSL